MYFYTQVNFTELTWKIDGG